MFGVCTLRDCNHLGGPLAQFVLVSTSEVMLLFNCIAKIQTLGLCSSYHCINSNQRTGYTKNVLDIVYIDLEVNK
jgi:hypothetical protein